MSAKLWLRRAGYGLVCAAFLSVTVHAASVGEIVSFQAGNITESAQTGSAITNTRTEAQKHADAVNRQTLDTITDLSTTYLLSQVPVSDTITVPWEDIEPGSTTTSPTYLTDYVQYPDRYVMIEELDTPVSILEQIGEYADAFMEIGYNYRIPNYAAWQTTLSQLTEEQLAELMRIVYNKGYGDIREKTQQLSVLWGVDDETLYQFVQDLLTNGGGLIIQPSITGGKDVLDFSTYEQRLDALNTYIQSFAMSETVKTEYIVEVKVESTASATLRRSTPQTWGDTGQTHFWMFECLESSDGEYHAASTMFGGENVSQMFRYAGKYRVTATQILQQTYYDALTYSVNEYWVVADTGQVIYKKESTGSVINTQSGVPMSEQNLIHVSYYKLVNEGTFYATVLDQDVLVTQNSFSGSFAASGVWDSKFNTQRVG